MRILCDQMVKESYVSALAASDTHTVARVRAVLAPDVADDTIAEYAARNDWVVLTADDDYFAEDVPHGLLFYEEQRSPSPGVVRDAIREIDRVYDDHAAIVEWIPDGWV